MLTLSTSCVKAGSAAGTRIGEIMYADSSASFSVTNPAFAIETIDDPSSSEDGMSFLTVADASAFASVGDLTAGFYVSSDTGLSSYEAYTVHVYADSDFSVSYVSPAVSRTGTNPEITVNGTGFTSALHVSLSYYDGSGTVCVDVPDSELTVSSSSVKFVLLDDYLRKESDGSEICTEYDICVRGCLCGSDDFKSCAKLIRYAYDSSNETSLSTGSCHYTSTVSLVYDSSSANYGGASGKYGKTMYWLPDSSVKCTDVTFYSVRLKYNSRLTRIYGEQTLDGIALRAGDLVWLSAQYVDDTAGESGGDGLWRVSASDWTFVAKVDGKAFVDLGARVTDSADMSYDQPLTSYYGLQTLSGTLLKAGDVVLLTNQTSGSDDGLWRVTCGYWEYLGPAPAASGTTVDETPNIVTVTDIDFCKCGIYHIWYYYMNGSCYLASARRTVKVMGTGATLLPCNAVNVTDYEIHTEGEDSLTKPSGTAGDPVIEDCVKQTATFDDSYREKQIDGFSGCTGAVVYFPDCTSGDDCLRYMRLSESGTSGSVPSSRDMTSFSIVFWKRIYESWRLFAYIGAGTYQSGMTYTVYEISAYGSATTEDVTVYDGWYDSDGTSRSGDFALSDSSWVFAVRDSDGAITGKTDVLDASTISQNWAIRPTTYIGRDASGNGMRYAYDLRFYDTAITKTELVAIYNLASCVISTMQYGLCTDAYEPITTDDGFVLATDF